MAYFRCKGDMPRSNIIAYWNLSKEHSYSPWIDEINNYELVYDNSYNTSSNNYAWVQQDNSQKMHYLKLPSSVMFNPNKQKWIKYKLEVVNGDGLYTHNTSYQRAFMFSDNWGQSNDRTLGLTWKSDGYSVGSWYLYAPDSPSNQWIAISESSDYFNNSTITLDISKINDTTVQIGILRDDIQVTYVNIPITLINSFTDLSIGSFRNYWSATIKSLTVEVG